MKKLIFVGLIVVGLSSQSFAAIDETKKRQDMADAAVTYSTQLLDALNGLKHLREERAKLNQDFQDSDFSNSDLRYLNAGTIGQLFDFVVPAFDTTYLDVANGGRNIQILNQVRRH